MCWVHRKQGIIRVDLDPSKLVPLLIGPGGAIVALLAFISYLMKEVGTARKERDGADKEKRITQRKYEDMREQRDEFRFLAGDAIRAGKRSAATQVAILHHKTHDEIQQEESHEV